MAYKSQHCEFFKEVVTIKPKSKGVFRVQKKISFPCEKTMPSKNLIKTAEPTNFSSSNVTKSVLIHFVKSVGARFLSLTLAKFVDTQAGLSSKIVSMSSHFSAINFLSVEAKKIIKLGVITKARWGMKRIKNTLILQ